MTGKKDIYNAKISAGSLLLKESREIAKLLLENADDEAWHKAIIVNNVLQKRAPSSAKRMTSLIRKRLELMGPSLWEIIVKGGNELAIQALMAAAIKHSRLLGDFMCQVIRDHLEAFDKQLSSKDWMVFLGECENRDSAPETWSDSTRKKLGEVIFRVLAEAKYIDNTRSRKLTPVQILPEIIEYLKDNDEEYVLKCMEINS